MSIYARSTHWEQESNTYDALTAPPTPNGFVPIYTPHPTVLLTMYGRIHTISHMRYMWPKWTSLIGGWCHVPLDLKIACGMLAANLDGSQKAQSWWLSYSDIHAIVGQRRNACEDGWHPMMLGVRLSVCLRVTQHLSVLLSCKGPKHNVRGMLYGCEKAT